MKHCFDHRDPPPEHRPGNTSPPDLKLSKIRRSLIYPPRRCYLFSRIADTPLPSIPRSPLGDFPIGSFIGGIGKILTNILFIDQWSSAVLNPPCFENGRKQGGVQNGISALRADLVENKGGFKTAELH